MTPEARIENYLKKQCKKHNMLCFKFAPCGINGIPDRIVLHQGRVIFVELKAPGKKPRPQQIAMHKLLASHGAIIHVIDTTSGVDDLLHELLQSCPTTERSL